MTSRTSRHAAPPPPTSRCTQRRLNAQIPATTQLEIWQRRARDDYSVYILVVHCGFVTVSGTRAGWRVHGSGAPRHPSPPASGKHAAGVSWGKRCYIATSTFVFIFVCCISRTAKIFRVFETTSALAGSLQTFTSLVSASQRAKQYCLRRLHGNTYQRWMTTTIYICLNQRTPLLFENVIFRRFFFSRYTSLTTNPLYPKSKKLSIICSITAAYWYITN